MMSHMSPIYRSICSITKMCSNEGHKPELAFLRYFLHFFLFLVAAIKYYRFIVYSAARNPLIFVTYLRSLIKLESEELE